MPPQALWLLLREVAAGLGPVHELDMVHRDLKPSNIMLTLDGLTLIDFGIARAAEQSQLTRTGMVVGTPAYMAPEQASGSRRLSGATDVFALGSVLAYAACGQPPFGDESGHGVLYRIVHEEPGLGPLRELEPDLAEIVAACLDKDPEGRPTAAELLERATRGGPFAPPLWPRAVTERLSERAAFAAEVQAVDMPTVPLTEGNPEPEQDRERESKPKPDPERTSGVQSRPGAPERPERRRNRVFVLPVLAVVVVGGTTLAIQHLPYVSPPRAEAQATPSAPAPAPDGPTSPRASGAPSGAASAGASPSDGKPGGNAGSEGQQGAAGSQGAGAGGAVTGAQGGPGASASSGTSGDAATSGTPTGSGASGTSGASGGAGSSGGSGTSGGSGRGTGSGGVTPAPAPPPASGTYRYRNGDNGSCITQVYGAADHRDCADSTARWTVRSGSDGSFKLVNEQTGQCLYSNGLGQAVFVGDCAQNAGRLWRTGTGGSLRSDYGGGCLDLGMSSGLVTKTCAGEASQRWTKQT